MHEGFKKRRNWEQEYKLDINAIFQVRGVNSEIKNKAQFKRHGKGRTYRNWKLKEE